MHRCRSHIPAYQHPRGAWRRRGRHGVLLTGLGTEIDDGTDIVASNNAGVACMKTAPAEAASTYDRCSFEENDVPCSIVVPIYCIACAASSRMLRNLHRDRATLLPQFRVAGG
jgi:hypothetical protein